MIHFVRASSKPNIKKLLRDEGLCQRDEMNRFAGLSERNLRYTQMAGINT